MGRKLLTPEEREVQRIAGAKVYLEKVEAALHGLAQEFFDGEATMDSDEVVDVHDSVWNALRLVRAYRRYPEFDPSVLSQLRVQDVILTDGTPPQFNGFSIKVPLLVPTWGVTDLQGARSMDGPTFYCNSTGGGWSIDQHVHGRYDEPTLQRNVDAIRALPREAQERLRHNQQDPFRLRAKPPAIPVDVNKRVQQKHDEFERIALVWEAEWSPSPVKDPLVVGVVKGRCFLIDQYDATKLERYISSEMCKGPRA